MTVTQQIRKAFNASAKEYQMAAKVPREIGHRLFQRLEYLKINPTYVLDLGCGVGYFSKLLKKQYPNAIIISLDLAYDMLKECKKTQTWLRGWPLVNADMSNMPFASGLFDLVFTNQVIHWAPSMTHLFRELNRVMKPNACLMFSSLGPDSFQELRSHQSHAHANQFIDMHHLGDCLMTEFFSDPVVDRENLIAHYASFSELIQSLKKQGVININSSRNPGLTGKQSWQAFKNSVLEFRTNEGKLPLTYEVVYGHAWKGERSRVDKGIEVRIPLSQLKRS